MNGRRFDQFAKSVAGASRRSLLKAALSTALGGALSIALGGVAAARGRVPGAVCRKAADCASHSCGPRDRTGRRRCLCTVASDCPQPRAGDPEICGTGGVCVSCTGVVSWAGAALTRLDQFDRLARSIIDNIASMAENGFDAEVVSGIRDSTSLISEIDQDFQTEVSPLAVGSVLRTLLEAFAAAMESLSAYLEQVYEENYIETGEQAIDALTTVVEGLPSIESDVTTLLDACRA